MTRLGVGFGATFLRTMVNDLFAFRPGSPLSRFGNFACFGGLLHGAGRGFAEAG